MGLYETTDKPTEAGWYLYRNGLFSGREGLWREQLLDFNEHGVLGEQLDDKKWNSVECFKGTWIGPLFEQQAAELERLRGRLAAIEQEANRAKGERDAARRRLADIADDLDSIVCTEGEDAGVVLLSSDGPTHPEFVYGKTVQVYDHEYFSPLGDALMELWKLAKGEEEAG